MKIKSAVIARILLLGITLLAFGQVAVPQAASTSAATFAVA